MSNFTLPEIYIGSKTDIYVEPKKPIEKPKTLLLLKPVIILTAGFIAWKFINR